MKKQNKKPVKGSKNTPMTIDSTDSFIKEQLKGLLKKYGVKSESELNDKFKQIGKSNAAKWKTYQNGLFSAVKSILMSTKCPDIDKLGRRKFGILEERISEVFKDAVNQGIIIDPLVKVVCEDGGINAYVLWKVNTPSYYILRNNTRRRHNNLTAFHLGSDGEVNVESHTSKIENHISKDDEIDSDQMKHWIDIVEGLYCSKSVKKTKNK